MKKVYDRQSKKWLTEEEHLRKYKKRESCKGGREHDWVHVLPYGVEATEKYQGVAEVYYDYEKKIEEFKNKMHKELLEVHGIKTREGGIYHLRIGMRQYVCSVCKKQSYKSFKE